MKSVTHSSSSRWLVGHALATGSVFCASSTTFKLGMNKKGNRTMEEIIDNRTETPYINLTLLSSHRLPFSNEL